MPLKRIQRTREGYTRWIVAWRHNGVAHIDDVVPGMNEYALPSRVWNL